MEQLLSSQLLDFSSYPYPPSSSSTNPPRKMANMVFVSAQRQLSISPNGCFPPLKQAIQRYSNNYGLPPERIRCMERHQSQILTSFYHEQKLNRMSNGCNQRHGTSLRDVVVRSEIASAGSTDDSHSLSDSSLNSKIRGVCFYVGTAVAAIILIVLMILQHPLILMFDRYRRQAAYAVARTWAFLSVAPFVKIEYEGQENLPPADAPAVYVSNHQSFFDIYTLLTLGRSFKFISKTSIFLYPIIGWAMYLLGAIPLRRMDTRSQLDCFKRCMALINKGASVFFFPEGTRSKDGKLGTFKKGAFSVATKTGVPVVPITLIGTGNIMPPGKENIVNQGSVKVIVHKPIVGTNADALCTEARSVIADELMRHC